MNKQIPIMTRFQPAYSKKYSPLMDVLVVLFGLIALGCFVVEVVL